MTNLSIRIHAGIMGALYSLRERARDEDGQDLLEYALLGGLLAAAIAAAFVLTPFQAKVQAMFDNLGNCIDFDNSASSKCF